MKRTLLDAENKRGRKLVAYVTTGKAEAVRLLGEKGYDGQSDVIRRALAALIHAKHEDMTRFLREDLK